MGTTPSRSAQQEQSTSSSASASPPSAPTRAPSTPSRKPGYRRNSLQPPASAKHSIPISQESSTTARYRQHHELGSAKASAATAISTPTGGSVCGLDFSPPSEYHYIPPPRRESIAETISDKGYASFPIRTREKLLEDAATLKLFPSPPNAGHSLIAERSPSISANSTSISTTVAPGLFAADSNSFGTSMSSQPPSGIGGDTTQQRRGSMESTAASVDEDLAPEADTRAIPTFVQWSHGGNKVYLTGTFCGWGKRYKLTKNTDDNTMSAVVPIPPGTHHVKFFVDGEMRTSPALPTAVDDTGILVNYLEVSVEDMPPLDRQPSVDSHGGEALKRSDSSEHISPATAENQLQYTTDIPVYLKDVSEHYSNDDDIRGNSGISSGYSDELPPPPSLPMMLQKVILNTSNQMKDDASVLSIPNHAVLNHLATSSIKNSILAVSATTRYKKKYVTTILYKAASSGNE